MSYYSRDGLISFMTGLKSKHPGKIDYEQIGTTVEGRPIYVFKIGNPSGGRIHIDAVIHGREYLNAEILRLYAVWLLEQKEAAATKILRENYTFLVPIINLDKYMIQRKNAHNVDLNRNFKQGWSNSSCSSTDPTNWQYCGPSALSEPECQALDAWFTKTAPKWYIALHTGNPFILYYPNYATSEYIAHMQSAISQYRTLCTSRGQNGNEYTVTTFGQCGTEYSASVEYEAYSLAWEFHNIENTPPPAYADVEPIWFPKFLPMAIAASNDCAVPVAYPRITNLINMLTAIFPRLGQLRR